MKSKIMMVNAILILILLTGCSEGEEILGKVNQLLDQQLKSGEAANQSDCGCPDNSEDSTDNGTTTTGASTDRQDNIGQNTDASSNKENDELNEGGANEEVEAKDYQSDQGDEINLPFGTKSFANFVTEFAVGDPAPIEDFSDPVDALGEPNYDASTDEGFVSLGGGGHIIVEFKDVYLMDGPGDDLYIFEVGPAIEAMNVEISKNGTDWIDLGEVSGGVSSVDIGPFISEGDKFGYVKITDLHSNTGGDSPGADIDAVAIINGELK